MEKKKESQAFHVLSLPHTVIVRDADDCVDQRSRLQHGEDGNCTDGHQLRAVAHKRSSTCESRGSRWGGDAGDIGGDAWGDAG